MASYCISLQRLTIGQISEDIETHQCLLKALIVNQSSLNSIDLEVHVKDGFNSYPEWMNDFMDSLFALELPVLGHLSLHWCSHWDYAGSLHRISSFLQSHPSVQTYKFILYHLNYHSHCIVERANQTLTWTCAYRLCLNEAVALFNVLSCWPHQLNKLLFSSIGRDDHLAYDSLRCAVKEFAGRQDCSLATLTVYCVNTNYLLELLLYECPMITFLTVVHSKSNIRNETIAIIASYCTSLRSLSLGLMFTNVETFENILNTILINQETLKIIDLNMWDDCYSSEDIVFNRMVEFIDRLFAMQLSALRQLILPTNPYSDKKLLEFLQSHPKVKEYPDW